MFRAQRTQGGGASWLRSHSRAVESEGSGRPPGLAAANTLGRFAPEDRREVQAERGKAQPGPGRNQHPWGPFLEMSQDLSLEGSGMGTLMHCNIFIPQRCLSQGSWGIWGATAMLLRPQAARSRKKSLGGSTKPLSPIHPLPSLETSGILLSFPPVFWSKAPPGSLSL